MENKIQAKPKANNTLGVNDEQELNYWSNKFGISKTSLAEAMNMGETTSETVEKYVKQIQFTV